MMPNLYFKLALQWSLVCRVINYCVCLHVSAVSIKLLGEFLEILASLSLGFIGRVQYDLTDQPVSKRTAG